MQEPEVTLGAALRDLDAKREDARQKAIRSLAAAYLLEAGLKSPHFRAAEEHDQGPAVRDALTETLQHEDPSMAGMAAVGLGMIGEPALLDSPVPGWVESDSDDTGDQFRRECAVIAISFLGAAAPHTGDGAVIRKRVMKKLRGWLEAKRPDVRFQAAVALVEVGGDAVTSDLVRAFETETHDEVRENLIDALSRVDPVPAEVVAVMHEVVADEAERHSLVGFEAAMILASAGDAAAGPVLVAALDHRGYRDRALEALAVLGRAAPPDAVERIHRMARALLTPGITRVRAAYALARIMAPQTDVRENPGIALLAKLKYHPRPAVREAVADAYQNLEQLGRD
jgi:HEAT repeat protein